MAWPGYAWHLALCLSTISARTYHCINTLEYFISQSGSHHHHHRYVLYPHLFLSVHLLMLQDRVCLCATVYLHLTFHEEPTVGHLMYSVILKRDIHSFRQSCI